MARHRHHETDLKRTLLRLTTSRICSGSWYVRARRPAAAKAPLTAAESDDDPNDNDGQRAQDPSDRSSRASLEGEGLGGRAVCRPPDAGEPDAKSAGRCDATGPTWARWFDDRFLDILHTSVAVKSRFGGRARPPGALNPGFKALYRPTRRRHGSDSKSQIHVKTAHTQAHFF